MCKKDSLARSSLFCSNFERETEQQQQQNSLGQPPKTPSSVQKVELFSPRSLVKGQILYVLCCVLHTRSSFCETVVKVLFVPSASSDAGGYKSVQKDEKNSKVSTHMSSMKIYDCLKGIVYDFQQHQLIRWWNYLKQPKTLPQRSNEALEEKRNDLSGKKNHYY